MRPLLRYGVRIAVAGYFVLGILVLVVRHWVLPSIDSYRPDIEQALADAISRPVAIRAIDADWRGLWPRLRIQGLDIRDQEGRSALGFENVEVDVAWSSLWHLEPRFARLELIAPTLEIRRTAAGRLFVAGLEIDPQSQSGGFSDWLLEQDRVVIRNAAVTWYDEQRQAPPLMLSRLNFDLRNSGRHHRFGLTADPPEGLATRLDVRGDFRGQDLEALAAGRGEAYVALDYTDLAGWRTWVDYPLELSRGQGGLRLWLGFEHEQLEKLTADVRLSQVLLRLSKDLPPLDLERLDGRVAGQRLVAGYAGTVKRLALATRNGIRIEPTDLDFHWTPAADRRPARGEANASHLDLGSLAALAGHLPLDKALREKLTAFGPRGRLDDVRLSWTGEPEKLTAYGFKARFADLGLNARGATPGFSGLKGRVEGDEKGGVLELGGRNAALDLPTVFPERRLSFESLEAKASWRLEDGWVNARLEKAAFQNQDAAGEAAGSYRSNGSGPGSIDLSARLTRADGGAVWRYMPLVVNLDTRSWLRRSIIGGKATATLRLKGDLSHFPFADGSGIFEVKGPFQGASLDYAPGWPRFEEVNGDLAFVGGQMLIRAHSAKLWGVTLADVKAEIPDLAAAAGEQMIITGVARGPTADFLRFIEASPVGDRIDHFTEDMTANGDGELNLRLDMPLRHVVDTQVDGRYRFQGNGLVYDPDLPPLADINGELHFTGDRLDAQRIRASMLGAPLIAEVATKDGKVEVKAAGTLNVRNLRQQYGHPVFEHLSGSSPWSGTVRVKKRAAEVRIESSLQGISSSLPEPFNKSATGSMPLVFERKPPPDQPRSRRQADAATPVRDQLTASLGEAFRLQLVRRHDPDQIVVERGLIAIGGNDLRLPERGVTLGIRTSELDTDFWRRLLAGNGNGNGGAGGSGLPLRQLDLRANRVLVQGRVVSDVQLAGALDSGIWRLDLKSREAAGRLEWNGEGAGRLSGHLAHVTLPDKAAAVEEDTALQPTSDSWPAIDLTVDRFQMRGMDLGALRLAAENADGVWNARFDASSDAGSIQGSGRWRPGPTQTMTHLDFKLTAKSIEKMLARLGYPNAVRRGTATLEGALDWAGAPTALDYRSLNGKLVLAAGGGQFNKLEPGMGRLLGIVSLQSLPRRITLDFRDIFTEGFAFDSINGQFAVKQGVMDTRDLQIQGPAAKVFMAGSVDLDAETQDLKVRVQPAVGETVATGVLLASPVVGAAAWVANKALGNPLDKAFSFDYAVTGSWSEPNVAKVPASGAAKPSKGETPLP